MKAKQIEVDIINKQNDVPIILTDVIDVVKEVIHFENQRCQEVAVYFVSNSEICALHKQFFNDASPTDCISLPIDENPDDFYRHLGEIFICPFAAVEYVKKNGGDRYEEILLYIIHGLLHLMGYDDLTEQDRNTMQEAERRHLNHLKEKKICLSSH